jgi:AcrR family transcriptional regulator
MTRSALRADAARNRVALVSAARTVFGERGLDAPLDEIARRAGVGNATLYRRFPNRWELVAAVFAETLQDVVECADRAYADPDPWRGFVTYVRFLCEQQAADRGLADLLVTAMPDVPELEVLRQRATHGFARVVDRAQAGGVLRVDFSAGDLSLLLMANAGLAHRSGTDAPAASTRLLTFLLDGLRT